MELLQIKFCIFEYLRDATILQVETFQKQILSLQTNCRQYSLHQSLNTKPDGCTENMTVFPYLLCNFNIDLYPPLPKMSNL